MATIPVYTRSYYDLRDFPPSPALSDLLYHYKDREYLTKLELVDLIQRGLQNEDDPLFETLAWIQDQSFANTDLFWIFGYFTGL